MASYWVSQERYFCKYCKVWLSNHKASIRNHDQGKKHVEIVEEFFRKKREDKLKGAQSESDLKRQMKKLEQAALRASEKDAAMFSSSLGGAGSGAAAAPPPPPPPPPQSSSSSSSSSSWDPPPPPPPPGGPPPLKTETESTECPPPPPPPRGGTSSWNRDTPPPPPPPRRPPGVKKEEVGGEGAVKGEGVAWNGVFEEAGKWYLEGQMHRDKLEVDSPCQIFLHSEMQWVDAVVLSVENGAAHNVPAVATNQRRFEIAYFEAGAEKETVLHAVEATALRLVAGEGGAWPPPAELPPPPPPDENTGMGGWQTVSVRLVDEAAEAEARRKKKEVKAEKRQKREEKTEREMMLVEAMDADDAMGSYDPWGTGKYKGFDIKKDVPRGPEENIGGSVGGGGGDNGAGASVSFKKRKGVGSKGKFRKKARDDQDD